jgi:hypothetical protein
MGPLKAKAMIRERDGYRCRRRRCRMTNLKHLDEFGTAIEVHRIDADEPYDKARAVTLCRPCHKAEHYRIRHGGNPADIKVTGKLRRLGSEEDEAERRQKRCRKRLPQSAANALGNLEKIMRLIGPLPAKAPAKAPEKPLTAAEKLRAAFAEIGDQV